MIPVLRIKNATEALIDVEALTDVGRKTVKARGTKEPLEDARETLGETMKTPGDAGETIVTPDSQSEREPKQGLFSRVATVHRVDDACQD